MKPSEIQRMLSDRGLRLTKSLGQNFLHDQNQLRRIIQLAELTKQDRILEIGPGLGPLTELLLVNAGEVLAIEKDRRLFEIARERLSGFKQLTLLHDDALAYLKAQRRDWSQWKMVSNLPYSAGTAILVELAQWETGPERMVMTIQWEVGERLRSRPGNRNYGLLTLLVQLAYEPGRWFKIPATCFYPPPEVDSACIRLARRSEPLLDRAQEPVFQKIVKRSFSQRRKTMLKLLKQEWGACRLEQAWSELNLSPQVRAEQLSLGQYVKLTQALGR